MGRLAHFPVLSSVILFLAIGLTACGNRAAQTDLSVGKIGYAIWPDCRLNVAESTIHCLTKDKKEPCADFDISLGSDGKSVIRCTH